MRPNGFVERDQGGVFVDLAGEEHANPAAGQRNRIDPGIFERVECGLYGEPVLRVHQLRVTHGNAEETVVEPVHMIQVAAASTAFSRYSDAVFRHRADEVVAGFEMMPERIHIRGPRETPGHADDRDGSVAGRRWPAFGRWGRCGNYGCRRAADTVFFHQIIRESRDGAVREKRRGRHGDAPTFRYLNREILQRDRIEPEIREIGIHRQPFGRELHQRGHHRHQRRYHIATGLDGRCWLPRRGGHAFGQHRAGGVGICWEHGDLGFSGRDGDIQQIEGFLGPQGPQAGGSAEQGGALGGHDLTALPPERPIDRDRAAGAPLLLPPCGEPPGEGVGHGVVALAEIPELRGEGGVCHEELDRPDTDRRVQRPQTTGFGTEDCPHIVPVFVVDHALAGYAGEVENGGRWAKFFRHVVQGGRDGAGIGDIGPPVRGLAPGGLNGGDGCRHGLVRRRTPEQGDASVVALGQPEGEGACQHPAAAGNQAMGGFGQPEWRGCGHRFQNALRPLVFSQTNLAWTGGPEGDFPDDHGAGVRHDRRQFHRPHMGPSADEGDGAAKRHQRGVGGGAGVHEKNGHCRPLGREDRSNGVQQGFAGRRAGQDDDGGRACVRVFGHGGASRTPPRVRQGLDHRRGAADDGQRSGRIDLASRWRRAPARGHQRGWFVCGFRDLDRTDVFLHIDPVGRQFEQIGRRGNPPPAGADVRQIDRLARQVARGAWIGRPRRWRAIQRAP